MTERPWLTIRIAGAVYADAPRLDDPAENYHEASKLSATTAGYELSGGARLLANPGLRASAARAVRRNPLARTVPLARRTPLSMPLGAALAARRSAREFADEPLSLSELSALLHAAYGVTGELASEGAPDASQPLRAAPSGGALYPLELFAHARRVEGLAPGLYHLDPLAAVLEHRSDAELDARRVSPYEQLETASASVVIAATFWRSRFKYGLRAYRFTLLEAGHVAQNILLAATALGLSSLPLGGFYDRALDDLLGLDGTDESSLAIVCVGRPP